MKARLLAGLTVLAMLMAFAPLASAQKTLSDVKARGALKCGVGVQSPAFAYADEQGNYKGFDVDFCKATAAAIGVPVKFVQTSAKERFPALQSGEVDLLYRTTTWTMERDTKLGFDFSGVNYYDGQGFMVRKELGVKSAKELDGASVCVATGTTTELNLSDYFRSNGMKYKAVVMEQAPDLLKAYDAGRCDVYTTDRSSLASYRPTLKNPKDNIILPEVISKEPLGPTVRHGDNQWGDLVRWVLNALIIAEEKGVTQANVDEMRKSSKDPEVQRMLGVTGEFGSYIGLSNDWAYKAIKAVGNYGEIFDRDLGPNTPIGLDRGLNQLWSKGGILYAPPIR
ncbi:MAG TPA: amino acid ABC transporter substrate-binding protein [bacterium]|nr:amino acid ABC transporter substrate-binding protein [bacterium]